MTTQYWLVKSEPEAYGWNDLVRDHRTRWTGVRNFAARNHLRSMRLGDRVLFYESVTAKVIRGVARVTATAVPDDTADEPGWVAVELEAVAPLGNPVSLEDVKAAPRLANMVLLRNSRLSVQPVTKSEFDLVTKLGGRKRARP